MFVVAAVAPSRNLTAFWLPWLALAVVHATHDIACDGFYLQALDKKDQALYSGTRLGAYRLAMIVGSSALVVPGGQDQLAAGIWRRRRPHAPDRPVSTPR